MQTLVAYDIGSNPLRLRVEKACRDFGMERAQWSAFLGELEETQRQRLCARLRALASEHAAEEMPKDRKRALFIQVYPICAACFSRAVTVTREGSEATPEVRLPDILIL